MYYFVKDRAAEIEALPSEVRTAVFPPAWRAALDSADDQKREANASRVRTISRRLATFAVIVAVAFAVYLSMPKAHNAKEADTCTVAPAHDDGTAHSFARERSIAEEHVMVVDEAGSQKIARAVLWPGEDALSAARRFCTAHIITHAECAAAVAERLVAAATRAATNATQQP